MRIFIKMNKERKHALIDCEYFPKCYENSDEAYLCPLKKEECPTFRLEKLAEEEREDQALERQTWEVRV